MDLPKAFAAEAAAAVALLAAAPAAAAATLTTCLRAVFARTRLTVLLTRRVEEGIYIYDIQKNKYWGIRLDWDTWDTWAA